MDVIRSKMVSVMGLRTRVLEESGAGGGDPVVMIHGVGGWAENWREVMAPIARTGRRTIAFDLPGFGESDAPGDVDHFGPRDPFYPRFVGALLDELGIGSAHLVGNSMGGAVAFTAAVSQPERTRSLALVAGGGVGTEVALFLRLCTLPVVRRVRQRASFRRDGVRRSSVAARALARARITFRGPSPCDLGSAGQGAAGRACRGSRGRDAASAYRAHRRLRSSSAGRAHRCIPRGAPAVPRPCRSGRRCVKETGTIEGGVKTRSRPSITTPRAKLTLSAEQIIADYRLAVRSRAASELGRREVLAGRVPFGIFGDGKEVAQLAMAHVMRPGDWRSGYYRDQTVMLAVAVTTLEQYFAQLYAD